MNHKYTMGIGTTLRYKDFSLTANMEIRQGGKMYTRTKGTTFFTGIAKQTIYNDRNPFIVPNSVNKVTAADGTVSYVENTTALDYSYIQSYWADQYDCDASNLISRSFVKLRDVVLTWNVPSKWIDKTFLLVLPYLSSAATSLCGLRAAIHLLTPNLLHSVTTWKVSSVNMAQTRQHAPMALILSSASKIKKKTA